MQIAKMFASLGFKVDPTGLNNLKKGLKDARAELTNFNRGSVKSTKQLRSLRREVDKLSTSLGKIKSAGGTTGGGAYSNMASSVHKLNNALEEIARNHKRYTNAIGKINSSVHAGLRHWESYRSSIVSARISLRNLNQDLARLRANSRINVNVNHSGNGGAGGGGGAGGAGGAGAAAAGFGLRGFMSNMLPSMALGGIGAGAGYAATKVVGVAREQTSMESMILMTSKSAEEFKHTVDYINREALRLGMNAADFGKSFAQVSMSADKMSQGDKEEMFTGFSEFMMAMGTSGDDQKGIFRAFNQMFSNNRILQEEINQLSERGIPATLIYDSAMKAYGLDTVAQVKKLQQAGQLDPTLVLKQMSGDLQEKAHDSGAFEKMKNSSMFKQNQFMAEMRIASKEIMDSGLDKMLGDLFGLLSLIARKLRDVATVMSSVTEQWGIFYHWLKDTMTSGQKFQLYIYAIFLALVKMRGAMATVVPMLLRGGSVMRGLSLLMQGLFGRALGLVIFRFGAWGVAIWVVINAFSFLSKEMKKSEAGKWTFWDELFIGAERAGQKIRLLSAIFSVFLTKLAIAHQNPIDTAFGLGTDSRETMIQDRTPKKVVRKRDSFPKGGQKDISWKELSRFTKGIPLPYFKTQSMEKRPVTPINLTNNTYVNGVLQDSQYEYIG